MLRTIYMAIYFVLYLLYLVPKTWIYNYLKKKNNPEKLDAFIHSVGFNWGKSIFNASGSKIIVSGTKNVPDGPVLFVSNHQGNFDIPAIFGFIDKPKGFIAKKELGKIPIFGQWILRQRGVFIDRGNPRQSLKAINEGIKNLKDGYSMVIFPEGTRSQSAKMGEFKKGSLRLATKAKVPIVPITIDGSYKIMEANKNRIVPHTIKMTISEPVYTDQLTKEEANDLSTKVHDIIESKLD